MKKLYIGIDLHKRVQTWVIIGESDHHKVSTRTYPVTLEALREAYTHALSFGDTMYALIEPVCGWIWVVRELRSLGIEVHISNPSKIRMIADSLKKNDEEDAYVLAKLLKIGNAYESYECSEATRKHRSLCRERCFLVRLRASLKCRLESVVTRDGNHTFSLQAKNRSNIIVTNDEVKIHQKGIVLLDDLIKEVEKQMMLSTPDTTMKRLMTIPGIGPVTAQIICAEVGDFSLFKKPDHLASFAGLVPKERSSGGKQRLGHITHAGSSYLRFALIESAMRIRDTKETATLYSFYTRIKDKGGAMKARVALARKLLVIMWHMIKKEQDYRV